MEEEALKEGLTYTSGTAVDGSKTASAMGSGDLEVFATPSLVALMENAAMMCVAGRLPEGSTTVGAQINISHIRATAPGRRVSAKAVLVSVDGRKLTFDLSAEDENGPIGEGTHLRYVVDREKFLSGLSGKHL